MPLVFSTPPENINNIFSDVFREYRKTPVERNGLVSLDLLVNNIESMIKLTSLPVPISAKIIISHKLELPVILKSDFLYELFLIVKRKLCQMC